MNVPTTTTRITWRNLAMFATVLILISFALGFLLHPM